MLIKTKFKNLSNEYRGQILIHNYVNKSLAFTPIEPVDSTIKCECGFAEWNATNFGNLIHFCPNKEYEVIVTDFRAIKK